MYNLFDKVRFKYHTGEEKQGKIVKTELAGHWVQVKESFSYDLPVESKGKLLGYVPMQSPVVDYFVLKCNIIGKVEPIETAAA